MMVGRRRPEPEQGHGSGISIGGNNNAPNQNVVGQNISQVYQSASVQGAVDVEAVRDLLASFRADVSATRGAWLTRRSCAPWQTPSTPRWPRPTHRPAYFEGSPRHFPPWWREPWFSTVVMLSPTPLLDG